MKPFVFFAWLVSGLLIISVGFDVRRERLKSEAAWHAFDKAALDAEKQTGCKDGSLGLQALAQPETQKGRAVEWIVGGAIFPLNDPADHLAIRAFKDNVLEVYEAKPDGGYVKAADTCQSGQLIQIEPRTQTLN